MSQILNEVLAANERYAATFGGKAKLIITPARHFAVLTCMDARLDPAKFAGLAEGDAHSSATPAAAPARIAIRSLVISYKLLGTREWFIIHHTDCGMELFTNETMPELLEKSLETARLTDSGWVDVGYELGSSAGRGIDRLTLEDARASVVDDARRIREHPFIPKRIPTYGYIYNVRTGRLEEVKEATPGRRGIGLVEIPFVEPEAEVCQADLLGVLVESGPPVTRAVFESKVAINVIDVMKPENA